MTILLMGSELFHARQTDMTKLIVPFCNFANVLKNFKPYNRVGFVVGTVSLGQVFAPSLSLLSINPLSATDSFVPQFAESQSNPS